MFQNFSLKPDPEFPLWDVKTTYAMFPLTVMLRLPGFIAYKTNIHIYIHLHIIYYSDQRRSLHNVMEYQTRVKSYDDILQGITDIHVAITN